IASCTSTFFSAFRSSLILFIRPTTSHPTHPPLSLHNALPILNIPSSLPFCARGAKQTRPYDFAAVQSQLLPGNATGGYGTGSIKSEEHTSELQSQSNLVCRLLLEKKKHPPVAFPDKITDKSEQ